MLTLNEKQRDSGIYAASTGNHGAAVALASKILGVPCIVYVPENSSEAKLGNMKNFGAEIRVYGTDCMEGEIEARKVAKDYQNTAFLMGSSFGGVGPNFAVFDNWIHEPSYLSGMIAGSMTKSNKIGMVGGYAIPEVNRLMHAFMDGARDVNPDVKFMVNFIDSWYDPPKAKESAFAMMDAGADIMYAERFGVSDAAVERGVKAIGNVIDTSGDYPGTILASALWHMEATIDKAISNVVSGNFEAADYGQYSFMAYGGGSLVMDESLVPADVATAVKAKQQEILDGLFRVNVNDARPQSDG